MPQVCMIPQLQGLPSQSMPRPSPSAGDLLYCVSYYRFLSGHNACQEHFSTEILPVALSFVCVLQIDAVRSFLEGFNFSDSDVKKVRHKPVLD